MSRIHVDLLSFVIRYFGVISVTFLLIPSYNNFSDRKSSEIVHSLISQFYPNTTPQSTIILTGDNDISDAGYPPPLDIHARFLNEILLFQPHALVIDILFADIRDDSIEQFVYVLNNYKQSGIPVYLISSYEDSGLKVRQDILQLINRDELAEIVSPLLGELDGSAFKYISQDRDGLTTIAHQLAQDIYDIEPNAGSFDIWWNGHIDKLVLTGEEAVYRERMNFLTRPLAILSIPVLKFIWPHLQDYAYLKVGPFDRIYSSQLSKTPDKKRIAKIIKEKVIFYGTDFSLATDKIINPVFSDTINRNVIDGIFYHAMALQNLIDGKDVFREKHAGFQYLCYAVSFLTSFIMSYFLFHRRKPSSFNFKLNTLQNMFASLISTITHFFFWILNPAILLFGSQLLIGFFGIFLFEISPTNWIAMGMATWIVSMSWNSDEKVSGQ